MRLAIPKKIDWKSFFIIMVLASILGGVFFLYENRKNSDRKLIGGTLSEEELKKEIGQMLMVGFRGTEAPPHSYISNVIQDLNVGGLILSDYDVPSESFPRNIINPEQTKKLIADLQSYALVPLLIATDAEGGNTNRLKKDYGFIEIPSAEEMGQEDITVTTENSEKLARELADLGFNMNLAPVVDVDINPNNPTIGQLQRSFAFDPQKVAEYAAAFIKGHGASGIITTAKHFPGYGNAIGDVHSGIIDVTNTYQEQELLPYTELQEKGLLSVVMVTHIMNTDIDKNYPATLSPNFLQKILRQKIGFDGVIISDDLRMKAIAENYDFEEAIIKAVSAGCDILLFPNNNSGEEYNEQLPYEVRDILYGAVKNGQISQERITESYNRICNLKKEFAIIKDPFSIRNRGFQLLGNSETLTFGEVVDMARKIEETTDVRPAFMLAILEEEWILEESDLCYLTNFDTGEGVGINNSENMTKVMNPTRDIPAFLSIVRELGKDPLKTPITCPMSFGWGGAMGPADFIPSTWLKYKNKIEAITGKLADPWNIPDALLAAGLYLADSGAASKTRDGEWDAAMIYFSGSANSEYTFYAESVLSIAKKLQADIDTFAQSKQN